MHPLAHHAGEAGAHVGQDVEREVRADLTLAVTIHIGRRQHAVRADQRDLDSRAAEYLAEYAGDVFPDRLQRLVTNDGDEPPDEVILAAPGTVHHQAEAAAFAVPHELGRFPRTVAPGAAR